MRYLIDTNLLVRLINQSDSLHKLATRAISVLHRSGEILHITPQVLIEFRSVATRPRSVNGLGLSIPDVETRVAEFETRFSLLEETPAIFPLWKNLVGSAEVIGKQVHDARLVAVCHAHGVTHLLTFNGPHFKRLAGFAPGINVIDPAAV